MLITGSITYFFTAIYSKNNETLIKKDFVSGFQNMDEANYKDTQITLTEAVLLSWTFAVTLNMF